MDRSHSIVMAILLTSIACGPPRLGDTASSASETGSDTTGSEATSSDTSTSSGSSGMTSAETSQSETADSETTVDFVPPTDLSTEFQCDPWSQDCPEGEKCVPYSTSGGSWDANKCVPVMGDGEPGEPCSYAGRREATDDCDETSICWNADGQGVGTCHAFCSGNPEHPECPLGSHCVFSGNGAINLCIFHCDPLIQNCGSGLGCYWTGSDFECVPTTSDIPAGEPCAFVNDCAMGLFCIEGVLLPDCQGFGCCAPFCELELGDAQCGAVPGTTCVPFYEENMAPPGFEGLGVCVSA